MIQWTAIFLCWQGGKGGGKLKQKQSAIPQAGTAVVPWRRPDVIMHNLLLVESFSRIVGRSERPRRPFTAQRLLCAMVTNTPQEHLLTVVEECRSML